jgi:hypothetical protein
VSQQEPFPPRNQPVPTNRFGTPIQPADPGPWAAPAAGAGSPSADPWTPPSWQAPNPSYPMTAKPRSPRNNPVALVACLVVLTLVLTVVGAMLVFGLRGNRAAPVASTYPQAPFGVVLPPALTALPPAGSPSIVTPDSADAALQAIWPLRERALTSRDPNALSAIEQGSALAGDDVRMTCGCLVRPTAAPLIDYSVFVERQQSYPAHFLAAVATGSADRPYQEFLGLTRASAAQPWRVVLDSGEQFLQPHGLDVASVDPDGYLVPISRRRAAADAALPARLAAYWQHAKSTGHLESNSGFAAGPWTTAWAKKSTANVNGRVLSNGWVVHSTYSATKDDPVFMANVGPWTLTCGSVHLHAVIKAAHGLLVQDSDQHEFGIMVAPGMYHAEVGDGIAQTCFYTPSSGTGPVHVVGGDLDHETASHGVS